jgi:hypothetical protein
MTYEQAAENLATLIDEEKLSDGSRNEATTRLHVIDVLLFQCLGWDRRDAQAEIAHDGAYTDYQLGSPYRFAIWEAKREGTTFSLPSGMTGGIHKLPTLLSGEEPIAAAIKQVLKYCQDRSIVIAVVSNGHQLIAFLTNRQDNVPPLNGRALVFTSLADMSVRFRDLWNNLSHSGCEARNLQKTLQSDAIQPPPEKLALRVHGYPGFKNRNPFQENLRTLAELFIEDLGNIPEVEDEFLRACYAPSGALSQYALTTKNILRSRYPSSQTQELRVDTLNAAAKDGVSTEFRADLLSKGLHRRPIVLLGDVGVGKTTFIRNLLRIEARPELERAIVFYIDFLKEPLAADLSTLVTRRCREILLADFGIDILADNFVRGVYHAELMRFTSSTEGRMKDLDTVEFLKNEIIFLRGKIEDKQTHLQRCIEHLAHGQGRLIVICLDNIDQRPPQFQEQVFQIGHSLAQTWPANVFISLRPDTFYHSRNSGALAAYQPRVFTVSPPRLDEVIYKRLQYAIDQLVATGRVGQSKAWLSVDSSSLLTYLRTLLDSFEKSYELMESLDNMSGGNIREAIRFVIAFIGSGHVNAEKIIEKHQRNTEIARRAAIEKPRKYTPPAYVISVHEFLRAIIYGDHVYYDPASSPVFNVFDVATADPREHFLSLNLLAFLERSGSVAEGFVDITKIFAFTQSLGFEPHQVHGALDRAISKKLIEPNPKFADGSEKSAYRITTVGVYLITKLAQRFVYIDAVVIDTPIMDETTRVNIANVDPLDSRVARAKTFVDYLDSEWMKLSGSPVSFDWPTTSQQLKADLVTAETAALAGRKRTQAYFNRAGFSGPTK